MSRTYKDEPSWVRANRTGKSHIRHHYKCVESQSAYYFWTTRKVEVETDPHWHLERIDYNEFWDTDNGLKWVYSSTTETHTEDVLIKPDQPCDLDLEHNSGKRCKFYYKPDKHHCMQSCCNPYKNAEQHHFYKPERRETRNYLKEAVKDYNTYGETDIEPVEMIANPHGPWVGGYW